ncbi:MAG: sigma-70 family RNA polymerase sigma factor [Actinomycetota bacterium]|nr:sigma-70 family RNA polymerase sigma factor [Actinomycetota bacterium]
MKLGNQSPVRRFERIFRHYSLVVRFAARRGSRDPEGIAAETMSIAWRRLDEIDPDRHRPWLLATARNLLLAEYRNRRSEPFDPAGLDLADPGAPTFSFESLDPAIDTALGCLAANDREALILIAWDELSPGEAARSLGISSTAFRVRLHRARRRFKQKLHELDPDHGPVPSLQRRSSEAN